VNVTGITEYTISLELTRRDCETLEAIARAASAVDHTNSEEAERYQALFQLAIQAMRAADYDSAHGKPTH
jgi:hypothetical protein